MDRKDEDEKTNRDAMEMFGDLRKDATRVKVDTARIGRAGGALEKYAEKAVHGARKLVAKMFGRKTDTRWARARRHIEKKVIAESRKREEKAMDKEDRKFEKAMRSGP